MKRGIIVAVSVMSLASLAAPAHAQETVTEQQCRANGGKPQKDVDPVKGNILVCNGGRFNDIEIDG